MLANRAIATLLCGVFIFCPALQPNMTVNLNLGTALALDTTDQHPFDWVNYNCRHYTFDLYTNLSTVGFDVHKVFFWTPGITGHWMVLVYWNNTTYVIEPQTDAIFTNTTALCQYLRGLMYPWYRGQVPRKIAISTRHGYKHVSYGNLWRWYYVR